MALGSFLNARIAGVAVFLGALGILVGGLGGVFVLTWSALAVVVLCLAVIGVCIALGWRWAVWAGRVLLWPVIVVAAFMMVPDREEAVRAGDPGLQWQYAGVAAYLLLCVVLISRVRR